MAYTSGSPGAGLLEIGIAIVLQDRFSNQARETSSQIKKLHMDAKNAVNANLQAIQGISAQGMNMSMNAGRKLASIVTEGAQFIDTMVTVQAMTDATQDRMTELSNTAQTLGVKTMFDSKEIAEGMKYLAMAGTEADELSEMIKGAAMVANATGNMLGGKGGTADLMTNIMRTYGIEAGESATIVGDQLTKATLSSNMSLTDLAESIKYAGSTMVTMNQSLPSTIALIGTLANSGIQASMAGTNLENVFRYLGKSILNTNYKGHKALESIGLGTKDFLDAQGNIVDAGKAMEIINKATEGMGSAEKTYLQQQIFGVRGFRAAAVIGRNLDTYRSLLEKVQNSSGFSEEVVKKRMESLAGKIDAMASTFENVRTTFAQSIGPVAIYVLKAITWVASGIRSILAIPVLGTVISTTTAITIGIVGISSAIIFLRTKWLLFKNDSQVSSRSWFALLKGGWDVATIRAERYLAIQTAILNQQKGGMFYSPAAGAMNANPNTWVGNAKKTVSKGGKSYYWVRTKDGGVVRTTAEKAGRAAGGAAEATAATMGKNAMKNSAAKTVAKVAGTGALAGVLGKLTGVGSRLLGLFGGPWGLAITAGFAILPSVYGWISDSISEGKENTKETEALTEQLRQDAVSRAKGKENDSLRMTEELRALAGVIQFWGQKISAGKLPELYASINIDGKTLGPTIKGIITEHENNKNFDNNTK